MIPIMKHQVTTYLTSLLVAAFVMMTVACASEEEQTAEQTITPEGVFTLNALRIDTDGDGLTRTTSVNNQWEVGDCVYIRNANASSQYAADRNFRRYIYRSNGYFTPFSDHQDSVLHFTGVNDYVEAFFRGDDQKGGGIGNDASGNPGRAAPVANGTGCRWLTNPFTLTDDQSTPTKLQTCDFLYTNQKVVILSDNAADAKTGVVSITLKHKVSWINVNVTIGDNHTLNWVRINNGSDKIYQTAIPTRVTTLSDGEYNLDLVGSVRYTAQYLQPEQIGNSGKTYNFKLFVIPQQINTANMEDKFIQISVHNTSDNTDYTYTYDMPHNSTYVKNRTYTYNLGLTTNHYHNIFNLSSDDDALDNSDLGKILCSDGSLVPTVAEAKDKGFTPLGILVQFSGTRAAGYTGMCMSYEDVAQKTTLKNALAAVYNYKTRDGKPNPGNLNWCSDWFLPTQDQWRSVMAYSAKGNSNSNDYNATGSSTKGVYNASYNYEQMLANQKNPDNTAYSTNTSAASGHTKTYVQEDIDNAVPISVSSNSSHSNMTAYWTSTITTKDYATSQSYNASGAETTNNTSSSTANTRAFFVFDSRTTPNVKAVQRNQIINGSSFNSSSNTKILALDDDDQFWQYVTSNDYGKIIGKSNSGFWFITPSTTSMGNFLPNGTASAMIAYIGSGTVESSPYNHGLAIAMSNLSNTYAWGGSTASGSNTDEQSYFTNYSSSNTATDLMNESSGGYAKTKYLMENRSSSPSAFPAFYYCWNNSTVRPSGASKWFLPSLRQWGIIYDAAAAKAGYAYRMSQYSSATGWSGWTQNYNNAYNVAYYMDNTVLTNAGANKLDVGNHYVTSTEYNSGNYWSFFPYTYNSNYGFYIYWQAKATAVAVRPFYAF